MTSEFGTPLKEQLEVIIKFLPGNIDDVAMMVPCHVNTLRKIARGDSNVRVVTWLKINSLYKKALEVKKLVESK